MQGTPSIKEECLLNEDKEKIKTLFPYVGKKPLRIGKEVAETFKQSGCSLFVDLFCGSIAMLCYLPWNTAVAYYYVSFGDYRGRVYNAIS